MELYSDTALGSEGYLALFIQRYYSQLDIILLVLNYSN